MFGRKLKMLALVSVVLSISLLSLYVFRNTNLVKAAVNGVITVSARLAGVSAPVNSNDAATKSYVDAATAVPTYYQTASSYNGSSASTACAAGYHMCRAAEWIGSKYDTSLGASNNMDSYSWYDTDANNNYQYGPGDCYNWSSANSADYGNVVKNGYSGQPLWYVGSATCDTSHPVLCCSD